MDAALREFVKAHREEDVRRLALQGDRWPAVDIRAAAVQIQGWQTARTKLPLWAATEGIVFPEHLAMEQCSSQRTAEYKGNIAAALPRCERLTDLTGGFGVDATMMARRTGAQLTLAEPQEGLCRVVANNLPLLGVEGARVVCGRAEELLASLPRQDLIYLDPSRRDDHGGRVAAIDSCRPDVGALLPRLLERAEHVMVKLSPMLDLTQALRTLPARQVHVVSVEGECKEMVVLMGGATGEMKEEEEPVVHCVNIGRRTTDFAFTRSEERGAACPLADGPGTLLLEPDASVMKAAPFRTVAARFALRKLHPNSHLYTAETLVTADFPGRVFRVVATCAPTRRAVQALLGQKPAAHLSVRNFPLPTDTLRHRLGLREGGDRYLFATTLRDGSHRIIVCTPQP